jgi:hypothetical protein
VASLQGVKEEKKRKATRTSNLIQQSVVNSIEGQGQKRKKRDDPPQRDHVNARNGAYSEISSSSTSWATLNWSRTSQRTVLHSAFLYSQADCNINVLCIKVPKGNLYVIGEMQDIAHCHILLKGKSLLWVLCVPVLTIIPFTLLQYRQRNL